MFQFRHKIQIKSFLEGQFTEGEEMEATETEEDGERLRSEVARLTKQLDEMRQAQAASGKKGRRAQGMMKDDSEADEDEESFECDMCENEFQTGIIGHECDDDCDCELAADEDDSDQEIDDLYEAYAAAQISEEVDDLILLKRGVLKKIRLMMRLKN